MYLQGRIPQSAKDVASNVRIETAWQKYAVYDVTIWVALSFQSHTFQLLAFDPTDSDAHELSAELFEGDEGRRFRKKYKVKNGAEFFRHAMHEGSSLFHLFLTKSLPKELPPTEVYTAIDDRMRKSAKFGPGLTALKAFTL